MTRQPNQPKPPIIALTPGDAAGIGPEVIVRALDAMTQQPISFEPLLIGPPEIFQRAATVAGLNLRFSQLSELPLSHQDLRSVLSIAPSTRTWLCWNPTNPTILDAPPCRVSAAAGDAAFKCLSSAISMARSGLVDAICTAPLNKESLHLAGYDFPGHTEILADQCGVPRFAMMLHLPASRLMPLRRLIQQSSTDTSQNSGPVTNEEHGLSIAHVTLHTSIASVPQQLSIDHIHEKIVLLDEFLESIGCQRRSIGVAALNPHGGENGLFGDEEARLIRPAVELAKAANCNAAGPLPVDTLIRRAVLGEFDGVVAMYHDQGHIPVKLIGFDAAVNITLGLPIVRTSPTHGTAFDRAWNPATPSDPSGMIESIRMATILALSHRNHATK